MGYAIEQLDIEPTPDQAAIAEAILVPPHRVLVVSANNVGKTLLAGWMLNWFFDNFNPGIGITTAPELRGVKDTCWKEVRRLRGDRGGFSGEVSPELWDNHWHYAKGYTVRPGAGAATSFQGRHDLKLFFLYEEACGILAPIWEATETMFKSELAHFWLAYLNPTDTTCQAYLEESLTDLQGNPKWNVFRLSALDHPNITKQLQGRPPSIPSAVTIGQLEDWIANWCEPVPAAERQVEDFEWRPGSGKWFRPGPIGEARILGRWPSAGTYGVWSDALWQSAVRGGLEIPLDGATAPEVGCDVARFGDDWTAIHVRWGNVSVHHESHNGWPVTATVGRLKQVAAEWAERFNAIRAPQAKRVKPEDLLLKVDDDGVGGGVVDMLGEVRFSVVPVTAGSTLSKPGDYPNRRSELWFSTANRARRGQLSLARLPREVLNRIRGQVMAPRFKLDSKGRRVVEPKAETKKKIGRSPDEADALNLAYLEGVAFTAPPEVELPQRHGLVPDRVPDSAQQRRGLFGGR